MKKTATLSAFAVAALLFAGTAARAEDVIAIEITGPMTGSAAIAAYAQGMCDAGQVWMGHINAEGGLLGRRVSLNCDDNKGSDREAANAAKAIVGKHPLAVIGDGLTPASSAALAVYKENNVLYLMTANGDKLTDPATDTALRIFPRNSDYAGPLAKRIAAQAATTPGKIYFLHDGTDYGRGTADDVLRLLPGLKDRITVQGLLGDDKDFSAIVTRLKSEKTGIVFLPMGYVKAAGFVRQAANDHFDAGFIGHSTLTFDDFDQAAGPAAAMVEIVAIPGRDADLHNGNAAFEKLETEFNKAGKSLTDAGYSVYAGLDMLAQVVKERQSTDPARLAAALRSRTFHEPAGDIQFDAKGNLVDPPFALYRWDTHGHIHQIGSLKDGPG